MDRLQFSPEEEKRLKEVPITFRNGLTYYDFVSLPPEEFERLFNESEIWIT